MNDFFRHLQPHFSPCPFLSFFLSSPVVAVVLLLVEALPEMDTGTAQWIPELLPVATEIPKRSPIQALPVPNDEYFNE